MRNAPCTKPAPQEYKTRLPKYLFQQSILIFLISACGGKVELSEQLVPLLGEDCQDVVPDSYLLVYAEEDRGNRFLVNEDINWIAEHGGNIDKNFLPEIRIISATIPAAAMPGLRQRTHLEAIDRNCRVSAQSIAPNIPWGIDRIDQRQRPRDEVYRFVGTGKGVDVYIVDTGIRTDHEQFGGRATKLYTSITADGYGANDCGGHGTSAAGVIGGLDYGVAKEANLYAVRVLNCAGNGNGSDVIDGLQKAVQSHHAANLKPAVVNLSIAARSGLFGVSKAIEDVYNDGITVVASVGNFGMDSCTHFPAMRPKDKDSMELERDPHVLVVGVVDDSDQAVQSATQQLPMGGPMKWDFDYGDCIDVFAPGVAIPTTGIASSNEEVLAYGTSIAAAHATGVVATYLGAHPTAKPSEVMDYIRLQATGSVVAKAPGFNEPKLLYVGDEMPTSGVQLATPYVKRGITQYTVYKDVVFDLKGLPSGRRAIISSSFNGTGNWIVDDKISITCLPIDTHGWPGTAPPFERVSTVDGTCSTLAERLPEVVTSYVYRGNHVSCRTTLSDYCGLGIGNTRLFLSFPPF